MTRNIKLIIAYDGTEYKGWQANGMGRSIEETLSQALEQIVQHPVSLQAASRTDAGVHARGQVVNFFTSSSLTCSRLAWSCNQLLPADTTVLDCEEMPASFHPTLDNLGKEYYYLCSTSTVQLPHHRLTAWHCPQPLDLTAMRQSINSLMGHHDFSAFCNACENLTKSDHTCHMQQLKLYEDADHLLRFVLQGDRFRFRMARNIVGTLLYVGMGKLHLDDVSTILHAKDRKMAGITAPAHGLILNRVFYT